MKLDIIMLNEICQFYKDRHHMFSLSFFGAGLKHKVMKEKGGILRRWKGKEKE
jgi:hypothetical protein